MQPRSNLLEVTTYRSLFLQEVGIICTRSYCPETSRYSLRYMDCPLAGLMARLMVKSLGTPQYHPNQARYSLTNAIKADCRQAG